jgi:hypothetical protein
MSATITWTIDYMNTSTAEVNGFSEVVLTCGWRCTGTEANTATPPVTFTNSVYGTCSFPEPAAGSSFTPYAQLTQAQVVGWCWENGVNQAAAEATVNQNIASQMVPAFIQPPLPWATAASAPAQTAAPASAPATTPTPAAS